MRGYAKLTAMAKRTWDDVTFLLGLLAGLSYIIITVVASTGSVYGVHAWDVTIASIPKETLVLSLVESIYGPCIWLIKLSLYVLYLEVFGPLRWLRYWAFFGILITGIFYFSTMVASAVMCSPTHGTSQAAYLMAIASARCTSTKGPLIYLVAIVNVISDCFLIVLPLPAVWSLHLPLRRKIAVSSMFLTGTVGCIASILGLAYRVPTATSKDDTWNVIPIYITASVEMTAGLMVCCMPTIAVVLKSLKAPVLRFLHTYSRGSQSYGRSRDTNGLVRIGSASNIPGEYGRKIGRHGQESSNASFGAARKAWASERVEGEEGCVYPLEEVQIRKTTDFTVTRNSGGQRFEREEGWR